MLYTLPIFFHSLNAKIIDVEEESKEKQLKLAEEIDYLLEKKTELLDENEMLRPYKMSYDTLKDTFDLPPEKRPKRGFRRPILATKKVLLLFRYLNSVSNLREYL